MKFSKRYKVAVIGSSGYIGSALSSYMMHKGICFIGSTRGSKPSPGYDQFHLDLMDEIDSSSLPDADIVYVCAALPGNSLCEENYALSNDVNVVKTAILCDHYVRRGSFIVFLSSNVVFGGMYNYPDERHFLNPISSYGKQKAELESFLIGLSESGFKENISIVRLTKVISSDHPLILGWKSRIINGDRIYPFNDLFFSPISIEYAAKCLYEIGINNNYGIFHLSGDVDISYFDFSKLMAKRIGCDVNVVIPSSAIHYGVDINSIRKYSSLGMAYTRMSVGITPQSLEEVISSIC